MKTTNNNKAIAGNKRKNWAEAAEKMGLVDSHCDGKPEDCGLFGCWEIAKSESKLHEFRKGLTDDDLTEFRHGIGAKYAELDDDMRNAWRQQFKLCAALESNLWAMHELWQTRLELSWFGMAGWRENDARFFEEFNLLALGVDVDSENELRDEDRQLMQDHILRSFLHSKVSGRDEFPREPVVEVLMPDRYAYHSDVVVRLASPLPNTRRTSKLLELPLTPSHALTAGTFDAALPTLHRIIDEMPDLLKTAQVAKKLATENLEPEVVVLRQNGSEADMKSAISEHFGLPLAMVKKRWAWFRQALKKYGGA